MSESERLGFAAMGY